MIPTNQVPEVNGGDAALEVHLSVLVEGGVGVDLKLAEPIRRHRAVVQRRVVRVRPRRPVGIAIPVVVAKQVVLPDLTETSTRRFRQKFIIVQGIHSGEKFFKFFQHTESLVD